ncbi:MAG: PAS domain-containing protein, partial [Rhodoferax sp.]|nr:PAS domain-containing protein [Rhodoferax sp.]
MNPVETAPINAINPSSSGEGIDVFVFTKDLNGNYTFANSKVEELFASPLQDILGRNDSSFFDLTKADQLQLNDRRVMDHGETIVGLEQVYFRNSDQARVYATHKYPLRGPFGSIVGMLGVSIDVSERTKAEEDLQLYKRVLDQIQDYVTMIDLEGEVMYINRAGSNVNQKLSKFVGQNAA